MVRSILVLPWTKNFPLNTIWTKKLKVLASLTKNFANMYQGKVSAYIIQISSVPYCDSGYTNPGNATFVQRFETIEYNAYLAIQAVFMEHLEKNSILNSVLEALYHF